MSTILWSSLSNGQVIAFDPDTDVLVFNGSPSRANVLEVAADGASSTVFSFGAKKVTVQMSLYSITTSNVTFPISGSRLIVGDNTTATTQDDAPNTLVGTSGFDHLIGGTGADTLDGRAGVGGSDTLAGGAGDDTYYVGEASDNVIEVPGAGIDTVYAAASFTLDANVEVLVLTGTAPTNGVGNELDNVIVGNRASNVLDGGAGDDELHGGAGDDIYRVDAAGDFIVEKSGEGLDAVFSFATHTLRENLEELHLRGAAALNGTGNDQDNLLNGNGAANVLDGRGGDDTIAGGAGTDRLRGSAGSDVLDGGTGADALDGGAGIDVARYTGKVTVNLTDPTKNTGEAAGDTYVSIEAILALDADSTLIGDQHANTLTGGATLEGRDGNDILRSASGGSRLEGGAGADALIGGTGFDYAKYRYAAAPVIADLLNPAINAGEAAGDTYSGIEGLIGSLFGDQLIGDHARNDIAGLDGDDVIDGRGGSDNLQGGNGSDTLRGGDGADVMEGGTGADRLEGGADFDYARYAHASGAVIANLDGPSRNTGDAAGDSYLSIEGLLGSRFDDTLVGNNADNRLWGEAGNDTLQGRDGADTLAGGFGNDQLEGGVGADELAGGIGFDYARYAYAAAGTTVDLMNAASNTGEAAGDSYFSIEGLIGSRFNDRLFGDNDDNDIAAGDGDDVINGRGGNDNLQGGDGADTLDGGAGIDTIKGHAGNDVFAFKRGEANGDSLIDFAGNGAAPGDQLVFQGYGTAAQGASFLQINATRWAIHSSDGAVVDILALTNAAAIHGSDYTFI